MTPTQGGYSRLEFIIPSRGLIGYRSQLMTFLQNWPIRENDIIK